MTSFKIGNANFGGFLEEIGLRKGQASTCLYSEEARRVPYTRSGGQGGGSIDFELGHVPCGRCEAEPSSQDPARHYVRDHKVLLDDVSARHTRPEEHEESGSILRWKATGWMSV